MFLPPNHASDLVCIKASPSQPSFPLGMKTAAPVPTSAPSQSQTGIWRPWDDSQDEPQMPFGMIPFKMRKLKPIFNKFPTNPLI